MPTQRPTALQRESHRLRIPQEVTPQGWSSPPGVVPNGLVSREPTASPILNVEEIAVYAICIRTLSDYGENRDGAH